MKRARAQAVLSLTILVAWCTCAFALDPSLDISQYAHTAWKIRDGFTKGVIFTMAQTPDGYLWLGTEFGLYRFDGVRAVPWRPPNGERLPDDFIRSLLVARDGRLWISTQAGYASLKDGKLTTYPELAGRFGPLLQDYEGTIWVGLSRPAEICSLRAAMPKCHGAGTLGEQIFRLYEDSSHNLWISATGAIWRLMAGSLQRYGLPSAMQYARSLAEDDNGVLLAGTEAGLARIANRKIHSYSIPGLPGDIHPRLFRSSDGSLWMGTNRGLFRFHGGRVDKFSANDGLSGDGIAAIFEDREGCLWVSTYDGLDRFRRPAVPTISVAQGLLGSDIRSVVAAADGTIWIGTGTGVDRWEARRVTAYRGVSKLDENAREQSSRGANVREVANSGLKGGISSLGLDDAGRLWASGEAGVFYFVSGRFIREAGVPAKLPAGISADGRGKTWILDGLEGLFRVGFDGSAQKISSLKPISKGGRYWGAMLPDRSGGALWIGSGDGGIFEFEDGQVRASYTASDGLGAGQVNHLRFDARGSLWAATQGGLSRIKDGRITTLTSRNGLPCDDVHWSMEDDDHAVWLYMSCGLARIERSELDAWVSDSRHAVKATVFDMSDGVRTRAHRGFYTPQVTKSKDGKIWFTAWDGISVIDPHHLALNKLPPPVHIENITADDKTVEISNGMQLPTGVRHLDIDYTALSLVVPEKVRFRVKLEGEDKEWRELVNVRHVEYTNLSPKHYKFRVVACNNSGVWNEEGATLDFVIPPAWYQTNWFRAACVAVFFAMLWGIYELRVRQLAHEFNMRLEERLAERTRIARDLHDTLLQGFQGLIFRFQAAFNLFKTNPDKAYETMESALNSADRAIAESRGAIHALRSSSEENNLEQVMLDTGRELASSRKDGVSVPSLRVIVEGARRAKRPIVRDEVYRIARELLRNAYRHAQAQNIEAELRYDDDAFLMVVRDDGRGIDPTVLKDHGRAGHWGLPGMYERAEGMGARLDFWSEVGAGTEVRLRVPAGIAYEKSGDGIRFKLFRKARVHEHRE